jgi:hypothetical protein
LTSGRICQVNVGRSTADSHGNVMDEHREGTRGERGDGGARQARTDTVRSLSFAPWDSLVVSDFLRDLRADLAGFPLRSPRPTAPESPS